MDPTVTAAAIGVGGTVVVGVAGFSAAIWNTRKTIAHARESKLWDRRAEVYVEALAAVHYRQIKREYEMRTSAIDEADRQHAKAYLATFKPPDWHELEACLQAFASELVFTAVQASSTAHRDAMRAFGSWQAEDKKGEIFSQANLDARTAADKVREAADAADDALVELIRTQLQGRGKPLDDWQVFATPDPHQDRIKR